MDVWFLVDITDRCLLVRCIQGVPAAASDAALGDTNMNLMGLWVYTSKHSYSHADQQGGRWSFFATGHT
jgi:hypothetical protein